MAYNALDDRSVDYADGLALQLQQKKSRLMTAIDWDSELARGTSASDTPIMQEMTPGAARSDPLADVSHDRYATERRWISPVKYEHGVAITNDDVLDTLTDPTNTIVEGMANAINRWKDQTVITPQFFATVDTGETVGARTQAFNDTDFKIPKTEGGNNGLTVQKLAKAVEIWIDNYVIGNEGDLENVYMGLPARHNSALITKFFARTKDSSVPVKINGMVVTEFAGIKCIYMPWLTEDVTDSAFHIPLWVKSGMKGKDWQTKADRLRELPGKGTTKEAYSERRCGAVRTQEGKVIKLVADGTVDFTNVE